jgi:hypothetical protein
LRDGLSAGEATRNEELRRAAEAKAAEKKRKRDERRNLPYIPGEAKEKE